MIAVCNSTPLIHLAILGRLDLLPKLFERVYCTEQVYEETATRGGDRADAESVRAAVLQGWLEVLPVPVRFHSLYILLCMGLDAGEASTIALALETKPDALLIDERSARIKAQSLDLGAILTGTIGVLARARKKRIVPELKPLMDALLKSNFWVSEELYRKVLEDAGEG